VGIHAQKITTLEDVDAHGAGNAKLKEERVEEKLC
jgi:hypothetical protein